MQSPCASACGGSAGSKSTTAEARASARVMRLRGATAGPSPAAAPPVMHEIVDDLAELTDRPALLHEITGRRVDRHHAVTDAPAPLALGVEPDDALDALADEPQCPALRVVVVVPG